MRFCTIVLLSFFLCGCGSQIEYEHSGLRLGDQATTEMLEGAKPNNQGVPSVQVENKPLPSYGTTIVQLHEKRIEDIWFAFDPSRSAEVYSFNEGKFGKPSEVSASGQPNAWIWNLKGGGKFVLNSTGWGRATSRKILDLKK